ncbi:uncharacterized protein BYT42DRAFT_286012 [Radiomyces spectabilis]|uniref:uncharacterized protein n=1 Tax=Radiomyces spectabilis TaxID=64574 RepID=UPI00221F371F|nr:uncharacterized protein BYT42DRAFT_286012 [Radiomyces spectabilis]KAI8380914.1 hypothetical protein BYT42DRAFT_286012 [Radiomyces spectabilis]
MTAPHRAHKQTLKSSTRSSANEKIPRPMNCFLAYRLEKQSEIVARCPGANHRDISKIIAKWWKETSEEEKAVYREKARLAKLAHNQQYPDYKYKPNKAAGRKTRKYTKRTREPFSSRSKTNNVMMQLMYEDQSILEHIEPVAHTNDNGVSYDATSQASEYSPALFSSLPSLPSMSPATGSVRSPSMISEPSISIGADVTDGSVPALVSSTNPTMIMSSPMLYTPPMLSPACSMIGYPSSCAYDFGGDAANMLHLWQQLVPENSNPYLPTFTTTGASLSGRAPCTALDAANPNWIAPGQGLMTTIETPSFIDPMLLSSVPMPYAPSSSMVMCDQGYPFPSTDFTTYMF